MAHEYLTYLVRSTHVLAMAVMLGGPLLLWVMAARTGPPDAADQRRLLAAAEIFERLFWLALGLQVMTGVGNLGAFGAGLPGPATAWGLRLGLKLLGVLLLFVQSLLRTLVVVRLSAAAGAGVPTTRPRLAGLYGATTLLLVIITLLAVGMAHA